MRPAPSVPAPRRPAPGCSCRPLPPPSTLMGCRTAAVRAWSGGVAFAPSHTGPLLPVFGAGAGAVFNHVAKGTDKRQLQMAARRVL